MSIVITGIVHKGLVLKGLIHQIVNDYPGGGSVVAHNKIYTADSTKITADNDLIKADSL